MKSIDGFARSLIQHAARKAPALLAQRLEEEWMADFEERSGGLARLRFGVGCCWATRVIAHEYLQPKVATAAGTATGSKVMTAFAHSDYSFLSRRTTALAAIIALHAVIIYGFATGLTHRVFAVIANPMMIRIIEATPRNSNLPPLTPRPTFVHRDIEVPLIRDRIAEQDRSGLQEVVTEQPAQFHGPPPVQPTSHMVNRVLGGPGKVFPNTDDFYPPQQIRDRTTGAVTVAVCTDERGRLTAAPALVQTSGSAGLDQGALRLAKAGSGHYRVTTEDGKPVSSCYPFRVRFDMRN